MFVRRLERDAVKTFIRFRFVFLFFRRRINVLDESNSSDDFNSFYTSQNRRILLHIELRNRFVCIKFDDCATYEVGLKAFCAYTR